MPDPSVLVAAGALIAAVGSVVSIAGTLLNNLYHLHYQAMLVWAVSNVLMFIWSCGFYLGLWNGGLSAVSFMAMYFVFTITNIYGIIKYLIERRRQPCATRKVSGRYARNQRLLKNSLKKRRDERARYPDSDL